MIHLHASGNFLAIDSICWSGLQVFKLEILQFNGKLRTVKLKRNCVFKDFKTKLHHAASADPFVFDPLHN